MMEHRCTKRFRFRLPMRLSCHGQSLGLAYTRNVCRDGMFLETDPKALKSNCVIEVRADILGQECLLRAMVVYLTTDGVGVCLLPGERDWYEAIIDGLNHPALRTGKAVSTEAPGPGCSA